MNGLLRKARRKPCMVAVRLRAAMPTYGRLRPSRSCAATHSPATTAEPSEISPHKIVAAMISASLRTLPLP